VRINSNTNCLIFLLASLSLTAGAGSGGRQRLQLIGERNLSTLIREPPGAEPHSHSIADLKISDDDRWIAIDLVAGHYEGPPHGTQHHHLLLVPADLKTDTAQQFDFEYQPQTGSRFFLSADAGIVVIADGAAVRVEDRRDHSSCSVLLSPGDSPGLYLGGFINAELFLVTLYSPVHRAPPNGSARYELYDRNCKLQDSWDLPGGMPATASPEAGHILLLRYFGGTQYETDLVEWPSWKVVNRWPFWQRGLAADKGRVLCFESFAGNRNSPVQCRDLANGTVLAKQVVVHDGDPLAVARSGKLAVGNDWFMMWKPFTEGYYWAHVKRQVLWDFRSGKVVASWVPQLQRDNAGKWKGLAFTIPRVPFICTLSHAGAFLLEGGDETVRMSRISEQ
jgi:hypothetical protein